jgi:hypothetical protein
MSSIRIGRATRALLFFINVSCMLVVCASTGGAQSLAQRVAAVRDGTVELHYASRPGICGDGERSFQIDGAMHFGDMTMRNGNMTPCFPGPVRVRLTLEAGTVRDARVAVGPLGARREGDVKDLGQVGASEAARYFLELAATGTTGASTRAVTAAILADSANVWRDLLRVARDTATRSRSTRHEATFWLGMLAASKLDGRPNELGAPEDGHDRGDPKSAAVFALSQLQHHEGIDPLIQVAQTNRDPQVRRSALFWLGESGDSRAVELFGQILSR